MLPRFRGRLLITMGSLAMIDVYAGIDPGINGATQRLAAWMEATPH
jgi:hypothetical protein